MLKSQVQPRLGLMVIYTLSDADAHSIMEQRRAAGSATARGNHPRRGQTYPALVVRDWGEGAVDTSYEGLAPLSVNLQVFLDGVDVFWATSRMCFRWGSEESQEGKWVHMEHFSQEDGTGFFLNQVEPLLDKVGSVSAREFQEKHAAAFDHYYKTGIIRDGLRAAVDRWWQDV